MSDRNKSGTETFKRFDNPRAEKMLIERFKNTLVSRLRESGKPNIAIYHTGPLLNEAADTIESLQAELDSREEYSVCDCCECLTTEPIDAGGHVQCPSCTKVANLEHERDRYREALQEIGDQELTPEAHDLLHSWQEHAREALKEQK